MNILVTGGAGFIGSHVCRAYVVAGHRVVALDNFSTGRRSNLDGVDVTLVEGSVTDAALLDQLFAEHRFEVVNHQAARGNPRESVTDPYGFFEVNVGGGLRLLEAARRYGTRKMIYSSSGGCVYGELLEWPATESHRLMPVDPYGASKLCFEVYLRTYSIQYGLDHTILRYPNIYGPRQNPGGEAGVISIFTGKMLRGELVTINGDGEQTRDYVFVEDCVRANALALDRGSGDTVNIGTGIGTSVNEIFNLLARETGYERPPTHEPAKDGEVPRNELDSSHAGRILGWAPTVALADGLRYTVDYIREFEVS